MSEAEESIFDFTVDGIDGESYSLDRYRGRTILVVNTASRCGLTGQFEGLEKLHREYGERGLSVLGFPCNQFAAQDPGSDEKILSFCQTHYDVTFPMHSKVKVNGTGAHPLYKWLKAKAPGLMGSQSVKWNFTKFLVNPDGKTVERVAPRELPETLRARIETTLTA